MTRSPGEGQNRRTAWKLLAAALVCAALFATSASRLNAAPAAADVTALLHAAEQHFNDGQYAVAVSTLEAAVARDPRSAEAYYWMARSYFELRDFAKSMAQAEKAIALNAKNSIYHQWLGRAYGGEAQKQHSFFLARHVKKEFEQAVLLDPSNISARRDLEQYCIQAPWIIGGSKDQAYAQVQAITEIDAMEGHLAQAVYYQLAANRPDLAAQEYRQVLNSKPSKMEPYLEIMRFYQERKEPRQIESVIAAAALVSPDDPRLGYYRGVARVLSGSDPGGAEAYLKSYLATTPDRSDGPPHSWAREWLGRLYESQGDRAAAAEQYRAALRLDPERTDLRDRLRRLE